MAAAVDLPAVVVDNPLAALLPSDPSAVPNSAIQQVLKSTADLANVLPTGTLLAFQVLSPILTNQGNCDETDRCLTAILVAVCGLWCFLASFSDSFVDENGVLHYGFATFGGFWLIDGSHAEPKDKQLKDYGIGFVDLVQALTSVLVFAAVALMNEKTVSCFFPAASAETQQVLKALPLGIGFVCSALILVFPTRRHGIGFPVVAHTA